MSCKTCQFYQTNGSLRGRCHRYPPTPISTFRGNITNLVSEFISVRPEVGESDWCGEYIEKDIKPDEKISAIDRDVLSTWVMS